MKNSKLIYYAAIQSFGVFIYVSLVSWFMFYGKNLFNKPDNVKMPIMMLLLLVVSAAITSSLVFLRPVYLYLNGQKNEAVKLIIYTIVFLLLIILTVILANILW